MYLYILIYHTEFKRAGVNITLSYLVSEDHNHLNNSWSMYQAKTFKN